MQIHSLWISLMCYLLYAASVYNIGFNYSMYCIYPIILVIVFKCFTSHFFAAAEEHVAPFPDMWARSLGVNVVLSTLLLATVLPRISSISKQSCTHHLCSE